MFWCMDVPKIAAFYCICNNAFFDGDAGANGIERHAKKIVQYRMNGLQKYMLIAYGVCGALNTLR